MANIKQEDLWFNSPDSATLCRAGGNGPNHPSQLYAIKKYVKEDMTLLDYGSGSATTLEALYNAGIYPDIKKYRGLDVIKKNTEWCKQQFPADDFKWNKTLHKIDEPDKSWDVVYSRHVVDHMESFEKAVDEHKRVAKELVIVVMWVPMATSEEHQIKNIVDQRGLPTEKTYTNEYTNSYSRDKVMKYLTSDPNWELLELTEDVGSEVSGHDWVFVLKCK